MGAAAFVCCCANAAWDLRKRCDSAVTGEVGLWPRGSSGTTRGLRVMRVPEGAGWGDSGGGVEAYGSCPSGEKRWSSLTAD